MSHNRIIRAAPGWPMLFLTVMVWGGSIWLTVEAATTNPLQ